MIHAGRKSRPYGPGAVLQGHTLFLLPTSVSASLGRSRRYRRLPPCIIRRNYINRLGIWNVKGINGTAKRGDVVDVFKEGKFELLTLMETKLKGNGEVSWCGVNFTFAGVQEMERAREGVTILLNDIWHSAVIDFGCVISRILWIKFKFLRVKVCVVMQYGPNKGDGEERERREWV